MIRILMVDDHSMVRHALSAMLSALQDMQVVGEAANGREALNLCRKHLPDVVVMDVSMPDMNGIEATERIKAEFPKIRVVAVSMYTDTDLVERMIKAGASGYLLKNASFQELQTAVREAAAGRCYLSSTVTSVVLERFVRNPDQAPETMTSGLTPREREVLQLLAEGYRSKEIAELLSLSTRTVEHHRRQIMDRLGLKSVAALTKYAVKAGISSLEF